MTHTDKSVTSHLPENAHTIAVDQLFLTFGINEQGLSQQQVDENLALFGANILAAHKGKPAWKRLLAQFNNALIYILIASGLVSLALQHYPDSGVIFAVILINAIVGFIQEG